MAKKKGQAGKKSSPKKTPVKKTASKTEEGWHKGKSRTSKAGLCTSVPLARKGMKFSWPASVSSDADIAMAAAQEWVMRQIILGAVDEAGEKKSILANDVEVSRRNHPELSRLVRGRVGAVYVK